MFKSIYFSSTLMWSSTVEEMIKMASSNGARGIELWAQQVYANDYNIYEYALLGRRYDIKTIIHSNSWDLNFASLNREIREASIQSIKRCIDLATQIGAEEITIHPPRETMGGDKSYYMELAYKGIKTLYEYGCSKKIEISLELMEKIPKEIATTPEELKQITGDLYDGLRYTLDVAHCTSEQEIWNNLNVIKNISKIHISNKQGSKLHTKLSEGDFEMGKIIHKLQEKKIPMVIEGYDIDSNYSILKENLAYIAKERV